MKQATKYTLLLLILSGCTADQTSEILQARADRQAAQWDLQLAREQVETQTARYGELLREFSDFQQEHDCRAK